MQHEYSAKYFEVAVNSYKLGDSVGLFCRAKGWSLLHPLVTLVDTSCGFREGKINQLCIKLTIVNLLNKWSKKIYSLVAVSLLKILPYIHPLHGRTPMWY
jgi:hypothetical protein